MKRIKKILKRMLLYSVGFIVFMVLAYLAFVSWYPSFGGEVSKERKAMVQIHIPFYAVYG